MSLKEVFMRNKVVVLAVACLGVIFFGMPQAVQAQKPEINILTWSGYEESRIIKPFEEKYNCKVNYKTFENSENMLTIWSASKPGTWDVVNPDESFVPSLIKQGKLKPLDPNKFPMDDFFPQFKHFDQHWDGNTMYAVPSRWGVYGLTYNTKLVPKDDVASWKVLWDPKYKGKVGIYGWWLPNMGNIAAYLGFKNPYDITPEQLKQVEKALLELKPNLATIANTASEMIQALMNDTCWIGGVGEWGAVAMKEQGKPVDYVVPKEGSVMWTEGLAIPADSQKSELALTFIQYMLTPEVQAKLSWADALHVPTPNKKAAQFLTKQQAQWLMMDEQGVDIVKRVIPRKLPKDEEAWKAVWLKFKGN
jgi:spermidine/putrescine transport system substrate-binding protein